nr:signal recognition particle-docking protein FtsY [uncultured Cohaesibacter sp.]
MAKKGFFSRLFGSSDESAPEDQIKQGVLEVEGEGAVDPADLDNLLPDPAQGSDGPDLGGEEEDAAAVAMMGGDLPAGAVEPEVQAEAEAEDRQAEDLAAHVSEKDLAALEAEEAVVLEDETEAVVAIPDAPEASEAPVAVAEGRDGASDAAIEPDAEVSEGAAVAVAASTSVQASETAEKPAKKLSWFERLKQGLSRSSGALGEGISAIFTKRKLDDDTLQDLEDILIQADLGVETAMTITDRLSEGRYNKEVTDREVQEILAEEVDKVLEPVAKPLEISRPASGPHVILMIGVNGAGKTTTIGKLAQKFGAEGKKVMMAAGDTFRAAAIDQLKVWGERTGAPVVAREVGSDAAGLAYDAMAEAKQKDMDVLLIDTAGRLQNRIELMAELEKIVRVIKKHDPAAPHSVLLVLDATTGQNALNQVEVFSRMAGVTGLVMTKLDGTARGGILVAISAKYKVPVHFIGVGEGVDDLEPFASRDFARAIAGL